MEPEDGVVWVYGLGDDSVMAFTDFGIETLMEFIRMHKEDPELFRRRNRRSTVRRLVRMDTKVKAEWALICTIHKLRKLARAAA
ncbi:hypothetical protein [Bradyrhizobium sp. USDA 4518]